MSAGVHATDGEAGEIAVGVDATRETLGAVRRDEDRASWEILGRGPDRHEWLGLPDGGLAALPGGVLEERITDGLALERPDVVLTFGPDGMTGHPVHIAVGAATTAAFMRLVGDRGCGFRRLFCGAWPQSALDRLNERRVASGLEAFDPTKVFHPRGVPDDEIACTIDQSAVVSQIVSAFRAHRSQWAPFWAELDDRAWMSMAGQNHMVQAWPPRPTDAPVLPDPLDGL